MKTATTTLGLMVAILGVFGESTTASAKPAQLTYRYACESELIFEGPRQNDHIGASMDVGQFVGNSDPEILAGTFNRWDPDIPPPNPVPLKFGYAYLLDGERLGWASSANSWPSVAIRGRGLDDRFGFSVSFVGNLNLPPVASSQPGFHDPHGAIIEDFAVSNPRGQQVGDVWDNRGEVFVFLSTQFAPVFPASPQQFELAFSAVSDASLILTGAAVGERLGYSMTGIGDWNADGYDDFAVGAPGGTIADDAPDPLLSGNVRGRVYLISGAKVAERALAHFQDPQAHPKEVSVLDVAMLVVLGDSVGTGVLDRFGFSLADLGTRSIGGVGVPSIAVGAPSVYPDSNNVGNRGFASAGYVEVVTRESVQPVSGEPPTSNVPVISRYGVYPGTSQPPLSTTTGTPPQVVTSWNGVQFGFALGALDLGVPDEYGLIIGAPRWDHQFLEDGSPQVTMDSGAAFVVSVEPAASSSPSLYVVDGMPPTMFTSYGVATAEEHGFSVGATGQRWGGVGVEETFGVCSFRGYPSINSTACPANSSLHTGVPSSELQEGGGRLAGILHLYSASTGGLVGQVVGEDSRDSVGWDFINAGDLRGDIQDDLILSSPRWGLQGQGGAMVGMEWGRVYFVETRSIQ